MGQPSAEHDASELFQNLRKLDQEGRAKFVDFLRGYDHQIFNALADPVERYCAKLNFADRYCVNLVGAVQ